MKRRIHTFLSIGLSLSLGALAAGQDSRITRTLPPIHPPKSNHVVQSKPTIPTAPLGQSKIKSPEPRRLGGGLGDPALRGGNDFGGSFGRKGGGGNACSGLGGAGKCGNG